MRYLDIDAQLKIKQNKNYVMYVAGLKLSILPLKMKLSAND